MNRLDFTDINRFLVSLGVIFIGFAFLIPWLFLKEQSSLEISKDIYDTLTERSTELINKRQNYYFLIIRMLPWITGTLTCLGCIVITIGLFRWYKKQLIVDQLDTLLVDEKRLNIQSLSGSEIVEKAEAEIKSDVEEQSSINSQNVDIKNKPHGSELEIDSEKEQAKQAEKLISIERLVIDKIRRDNPLDFGLKSNIKLPDRSTADIILQSFVKLKKDKAIEIKYVHRKLNFKVIGNAMRNLKFFMGSYSRRFNKSMVGYVIVIFKEGVYTPDEIESLQKTSIDYKNENKLNHVHVRLFQDSKIDGEDFSFLYS